MVVTVPAAAEPLPDLPAPVTDEPHPDEPHTEQDLPVDQHRHL
jgi:hypothetical protein